MLLRMFATMTVAFMIAGCSSESVREDVSHDHPASPHASQASLATPGQGLTTTNEVTATHDAAHAAAHGSAHTHGAPTAATTAAHEHAHAAYADVTSTVQQNVDKLFAAYLALGELLAADKTDGASRQLSAIHHAGHDLSDSADPKVQELGEKIGKAAHEKAESLEAMRASYRAVSPAAIDLAHLVPPGKSVAPAIHQAYCPMAKAGWLQIKPQIANPYFGSKMLSCGSVTETISPREDGSH